MSGTHQPQYVHVSRIESLEHHLGFLAAQVSRLTENVERLVRVEERLEAMKEHQQDVTDLMRTSIDEINSRLDRLDGRVGGIEQRVMMWVGFGTALISLITFLGKDGITSFISKIVTG